MAEADQRVLGDRAHLNRVARNAHVHLLYRQRLAACQRRSCRISTRSITSTGYSTCKRAFTFQKRETAGQALDEEFDGDTCSVLADSIAKEGVIIHK